MISSTTHPTTILSKVCLRRRGSENYCRPLLLVLVIILLSSCDALALAAKDGAPEDNPNNNKTKTHNNNNNNRIRRRRRMQVAPLNTYLKIKDEFDNHRTQIENFVFQTLDAFATPIEEDDDPTTTAFGQSNGRTSPSREYTYGPFFESLRTMSVDGILGQSFHVDTNPYYDSEGESFGSSSSSSSSSSSPNNAYINDETNKAFYLAQQEEDNISNSNNNSMKYAIVNICAFLANAMVESIQFDACEELNGVGLSGLDVDKLSLSKSNDVATTSTTGRGLLSELNGVNGRYFPMSNACGQYGQLYQENPGEQCNVVSDDPNDNDEDMSCRANPNLEMTAATHPKYNYQESLYNSDSTTIKGDQPPPPFYCGKKRDQEDYSGYWDGYNVEFVRRVAYPSTVGKIDVQGCCFWGRGALMTKSTCGLGRLNYYMGNKAYNDQRPSRYPNVNFCTFPSVICGVTNAQLSGRVYPELRYIVALFHWIDRVQSYSNSETGWDYLDQLKRFVDGGMKEDEEDDGTSFIDTVSSVLTRNCDGYYCSMQSIHFLEERRRNFNILIHDIFNLQDNFGGGGSSSQSLSQQPQPKYNFDYAMRWLHSKRSRIEGNIFVSKNNALDGVSYFSQEYRYEPFLSALRTTAYFGVGEQRFFFVSDEKEGLRGFNAGLANLAFFLANAMAESITNDSCDEFHWDKVGSQYAIANSCGQNGRDYGQEICPPWQSFMTCKVDTGAEMEAEVPMTSLPPFLLDAQPPPFQCRPGNTGAGSWDENTQTLNENDATFSNSFGRTDIEGCCYWGRGILLTRGSCNYGKLNFHLGALAAAQDRPAIYPNVDFCTQPDSICTEDSMEMRFVVGMFEWIDRVQDYYDSVDEWSYKDELYKFVDSGMDDDVFIDAVSNIVARGCHKSIHSECSSPTISVQTNRFLYGIERRMHFKNIIRLVFELPLVAEATDREPWSDSNSNSVSIAPPPPSVSSQTQTTPRPTFPPTFKPTPQPTPQPIGESTATSPITPRPTRQQGPTSSPFEFSDITIYNDGGTVVVNAASSFTDENIVVTRSTTLMLEEGGYIEAPLNTDWPAIRVSIGSTFIGNGGYVNGSYADSSFVEGEYEDGGEAIHVNNGQSSPETASKAEFYDGIYVIGGDAPVGIGGNALHVNGFGTEAFIFGGSFIGGTGIRDDGLSLYVLNSATAHVRSGSFVGDMKVERSGTIIFYGCFRQDGARVTGAFADETELDVIIRTYYGGEVVLIPLAEQECETAPSTSPTNFPTISSRPTIPRPNGGANKPVSFAFHIVAASFAVSSVLLVLG